MRIALIGECCQDIYHYGVVTKINAEAPTPVFETKETKIVWGMAGNVYNNLRSLRDDWVIDFYHQKSDIAKERFVDSKSGYILFRNDINDKVPEEESMDQLYPSFNPQGYDAIIISSYNKGFLDEFDANLISVECLDLNIPLFVDCKWRDLSWGRRTTYFKINEKEYGELIEAPLAANLIVTSGQNGVRWYGTDYEAPQVEVKGVTGAGDVFLACLAVKYVENTKNGVEHKDSMDDAIKYAVKGASYSVTQKGTTIVKETDFLNNYAL